MGALSGPGVLDKFPLVVGGCSGSVIVGALSGPGVLDKFPEPINQHLGVPRLHLPTTESVLAGYLHWTSLKGIFSLVMCFPCPLRGMVSSGCTYVCMCV